MTNIRSRQNRHLHATLASMFAFLPLSGCDSLWRVFTMDVPVIDPFAKVSCAAPLLCTPPS